MYSQYEIEFKTVGMINITKFVEDTIKTSGKSDGVCTVYSMDNMAGIIMSSSDSQAVRSDIMDDLESVFPPRTNYTVKGEPESSAARSKSAIMGASLEIIIRNGIVVLGERQGIFIIDYRGNRKVTWVAACCGKDGR